MRLIAERMNIRSEMDMEGKDKLLATLRLQRIGKCTLKFGQIDNIALVPAHLHVGRADTAIGKPRFKCISKQTPESRCYRYP